MLASNARFEFAPIAETVECGSNRPRNLARSTRPTIDGSWANAQKLSSSDLGHAEILQCCAKHLVSHGGLPSKPIPKRGFEPLYLVPETSVLPLDDSGLLRDSSLNITHWHYKVQPKSAPLASGGRYANGIELVSQRPAPDGRPLGIVYGNGPRLAQGPFSISASASAVREAVGVCS